MKEFPPLITYGAHPDGGGELVVFAVTDPMYRIPLQRNGVAVYVEWKEGIPTSGWIAEARRHGDWVASLCEKMGPIVNTGWLMVAGVGLLARVETGRSDDCMMRIKNVLIEMIGSIEFVLSDNPEALKGYMGLTFRVNREVQGPPSKISAHQ